MQRCEKYMGLAPAFGRIEIRETRRAAKMVKRVISVVFVKAEDGIRDYKVTGVQTCALPIWARYTFLGTEPREVWRCRGGGRTIDRWTKARGWEVVGDTDDPIGDLAQRMRALPAVPVPGLPRFTGGAVGYLGYDLVRTVERLPHPPAATLAVPDAAMMIADPVVILDNVFGRAI